MSIDFSNYVRVTNTHAQAVIASFDGEQYEFKPGKAEDVHVAAARHIFGFGLNNDKDKLSVLARLGLNSTSDKAAEGKSFLDGIKFEPVPITPAPISEVVALHSADGNTPEGSQALTGDDLDGDDGDDGDDGEEVDEEEAELPTARARSGRR